MALCCKDTEVASRAMSRAALPSQGDDPLEPPMGPRWQLICGALVIRSAHRSTQLVRPSGPGGWKGGGGEGLAEHAVGS